MLRRAMLSPRESVEFEYTTPASVPRLSPNNNSRPLVTIDHAAYPNIMDKILNACSQPVLFAFRATSRAFRERIDKRLFRHVVLTSWKQNLRKKRLWIAQRDNLPTSEWKWGYIYPSDEGRSFPVMLPLAHKSATFVSIPWNSMLSTTSELTNLHTLLRCRETVWNTAPTIPSLKRLIDFSPVRFSSEPAVTLDVPGGLEEYILNLIWEDDSWKVESENLHVRLNGPLACMTIVLHPVLYYEKHRAPEPLPLLRGLCEALHQVLIEGGVARIVAIEEVPRENMAFGAADEKVELQHGLEFAIISRFKRRLRETWIEHHRNEADPAAVVAELVNRVDFVNVKRWHAELKAKGEDKKIVSTWPVYDPAPHRVYH